MVYLWGHSYRNSGDTGQLTNRKLPSVPASSATHLSIVYSLASQTKSTAWPSWFLSCVWIYAHGHRSASFLPCSYWFSVGAASPRILLYAVFSVLGIKPRALHMLYSRWSSTEPPSVRSSKPPSILMLARLTTIVFGSSSGAKFYWAVLCGDHILLRGDAECISLCLYKTDGMPKIMSTVAGVGSLAIWCYHVSSYQGGQRETRKATQKTQCGTLNRASECLVPSC